MAPASSVVKDESSVLKGYPPSEQFLERTATKVLLMPNITHWVMSA